MRERGKERERAEGLWGSIDIVRGTTREREKEEGGQRVSNREGERERQQEGGREASQRVRKRLERDF